jgi:integrase
MAKPQRWTDEWVKSLEHAKPGEPERVYYDAVLSGHRLIISRTKKTFEIQAQQPTKFQLNGKRRTFKVQTGDALDTTIEECRERAAAMLARIRRGEDPRGKSPEKDTTLGGAWTKHQREKELGPRTRAMYEGMYRRNLEKWKAVTLRTLVMNPSMAYEEHRAITKRSGPSEADHAMRLLRTIYNHAAMLDVSIPGDRNPCSAVQWHGDNVREGAAIPALQMPDWKRRLEALREKSPSRAGFFMLNLRLGTRPGELARRQWSDVEWDRRALIMPESKKGPYEIPLTRQCIDELRKLEEGRGLNKPGNDFIFPSRTGKRGLGHLAQLIEPANVLPYTGNCGRHSHKTIGMTLVGTKVGLDIGLNELVLDVLEGRSILKAGLAGRGYIETTELKLREARQLQRADAERVLAEQQRLADAAIAKAEAERLAALDAERENARAGSWKHWRFDEQLRLRPREPIGPYISGILASPPADGSWPPGVNPDTDFTFVNALPSSRVIASDLADTRMGRMLLERMDHDARLKAA